MVRREDIKKLLFLSEKLRTKILHLTHIDKPEGSKVLVLAPHPGDDILGCGGTIILHRQLGHSVDILYLTNGEKGVPGANPNKAGELRKSEALKAAMHLGMDEKNLHFMHLPDGDLINHSGSNYEFRQILEHANPQVIYLPSFVEKHRDLYATNVLLKNNLIQGCDIAAYEIWTPHIPNRLVNISPVIEQKRMAMSEHASQLKELAYLEASIGLNRFRAGMYSVGIQYAEAFIYDTSEHYFELMMETE
ncbi:MAG TPA: PIG-L family deacetylase [Saprospiraceae bacterium]|nr:PIG-L family deacetylase [Saprospiraceae bacterium]